MPPVIFLRGGQNAADQAHLSPFVLGSFDWVHGPNWVMGLLI